MISAVASIDHVSYAYGRDVVVDDVSLELCGGEFVALVGPNGSGKSTLLRLLVGLLAPSHGSVSLFGTDPRRLRERARLGFVPQRPRLAAGVHATVDDIVRSGRLTRNGWIGRRRPSDQAAIDAALDAVGLTELRGSPIDRLSGGQQQRAFIARALAGEPELLVLDEPVAGVDADSQRAFCDSLSSLVDDRGGTVLLVSHELGAVADALDRVVVLKQRVLFDGTPRDLTERGVSLGIHESDLPLWLEGVQTPADPPPTHRHSDHGPG
jgi:zinc transport system ATP-binding protein